MPRPLLSQVHIDRPLTNISVAYRNRNANLYVANQVFPRVGVNFRSDIYYKWNKGDWFRGGMRKRSPGSESWGGDFGLGTDTYSADVWALHSDLADMIAANQDPGIDLRSAKTEWLQQQALITREQDWVLSFFTSGLWGNDASGFDKWDDYVGSDPASQLEDAKLTVQGTTGFKPNTMVVGAQVHAKLKYHPLILDRFKYTSDQSVTEALLARYFEVDRYLVAGAIQNTGDEGGSDSYSFIVGKHAWIGYVNPAPGMLVPSAGYQFVWNEYGTDGAGMMKSFRMEHLSSERLEIENAWDDKIVGADLGYFWPSVIA